MQFSLTTVTGFICVPKFIVIPPVTIVTINTFTNSMTTLNKTEYMCIHILIVDSRHPEDHVYQKPLSYIYTLGFCFRAAAINISRCKQEINYSSHVTICTNHVKLHIFNWDPLIIVFFIFAVSALKHQSIRFLELYLFNLFYGLNGLIQNFIHKICTVYLQCLFLLSSFIYYFLSCMFRALSIIHLHNWL